MTLFTQVLTQPVVVFLFFDGVVFVVFVVFVV
jgi:hypothetical protein